MVRSLHLAVGFPVVTHVLTRPPAHLAPCGPKRPAAPRHMSHCSAPHPCSLRHACAACKSSVSSKPCASRPTTLSARPCATRCSTHALPAYLCTTCNSPTLPKPRAAQPTRISAPYASRMAIRTPFAQPTRPPPRTSRLTHCLRISTPHASRTAMHALSAPPARPCTPRFAVRTSFGRISHAASTRKRQKSAL